MSENKKILLIEDNIDVRENTAEILELAGYNVYTAENGKIGVDLAQKEKPDLIICDIMMPVLDGYGVLFMLSKNTETASIPFIFLTAKAERIDFRKGMEMGADDYITKPFDDMELLNAVESRLKKHEILKTEFSKNVESLEDFFQEIKSIHELNKLSDDRKIKYFKKKDLVFKEGSYPGGLYFVNKGKVKTFKTNEDGKEFITALHKEGDFIGHIALIEETTHSESAMALEDSEIYIIPKEDFHSIIYKNREVAGTFIKMLSNNLKEKEEHLLKLAYNSVRKRVAEALVTLKDKYHDQNESENFSMAISREDLANMVGTATESLIRTLGDFKEENMIEVKGSNITIVDYEKLSRLRN
jgi:CRP/FNR family transcriptional regulator, polysaccharide utilization system transcription regulator